MAHRQCDAAPVGLFDVQLLLAEAGQAIELRTASRVRLPPFGADEAALFESIKGRKERPRLDVERTLRDLSNTASNAQSVQRHGHQAPQDEQVERTAHEISARIHACSFRISIG